MAPAAAEAAAARTRRPPSRAQLNKETKPLQPWAQRRSSLLVKNGDLSRRSPPKTGPEALGRLARGVRVGGERGGGGVAELGPRVPAPRPGAAVVEEPRGEREARARRRERRRRARERVGRARDREEVAVVAPRGGGEDDARDLEGAALDERRAGRRRGRRGERRVHVAVAAGVHGRERRAAPQQVVAEVAAGARRRGPGRGEVARRGPAHGRVRRAQARFEARGAGRQRRVEPRLADAVGPPAPRRPALRRVAQRRTVAPERVEQLEPAEP